jgi:cyclohexanecarboxylate-CoA ligase
MEVRVIGEDGAPLPPGQVGALQSRGAANFIGYLKRPELYAHDAAGWFDTGDLARMEADGYIRITGRARDVIIRGGENIPVVEVEDLLYTHPAIIDAAIVAMQDERLGERACAFVTLKPGRKLDLDELAAFLTEKEMTRTYLPERLEIIAEMPRTASGKIQKFILREAAKDFTV